MYIIATSANVLHSSLFVMSVQNVICNTLLGFERQQIHDIMRSINLQKALQNGVNSKGDNSEKIQIQKHFMTHHISLDFNL